MDDHTPAEDLPHLYRTVLETVTRLEHLGDRDAAWRIRRDALKVYSTRWDERGRRQLERISLEAAARLASTRRVQAVPAFSPSSEPA